MKNTLMRTLLLIAFALSGWSLSGQDEPLELYIQPDIQAKEVGRATLDDPRLGQPTPVLDEARAALGWHFAEFTDEVEGFVPDSKIGKDLLPVNDTVVRAGPSSDSPVLGVYKTGDSIEVMDTGTWWKIRSKMAFPVYFVLDSPPPLPPVTGAVADSIEEMPPEPVLVEPVITESTIVDAGSDSLDPIRPKESLRPARPDIMGQSYAGTFKQSKKFLGLFKPKSPFYLEGADGKRIAWVDIENIVIPGSLKAYLDKAVIIHGEREYLSSGGDWIIRARNMRFK
jgi:hypothetical protein